jgi:hypothetical protein
MRHLLAFGKHNGKRGIKYDGIPIGWLKRDE